MNTCLRIFEMQLSPTRHLLVNKIPFVDIVAANETFDMVFHRERYELGVLVSLMRVDNVWTLMKLYNQRPLFSLLLLLCEVVLFNWFVLRRRGWQLFAYNDVVPMTYSQAAAIIHRRGLRRGARIFIGTLLLFITLVTAIVSSTTVSKFIIHLPDRSIQTIPQLLQRKMPIYKGLSSFCTINMGRYRFGDTLPTLNGSVWGEGKGGSGKVAVVVEMTLQEFLLKSAANVDENGREKYYLLDEMVLSRPGVHLFPRNSPLSDVYRRMSARAFEAALSTRWARQQMDGGGNGDFRNFPLKLRFGKFEARPWPVSRVLYCLTIWVLGLGVAVVAFVLEHVVVWWGRKREAVQRRERRRNRSERLRRIMGKYQ